MLNTLSYLDLIGLLLTIKHVSSIFYDVAAGGGVHLNLLYIYVHIAGRFNCNNTSYFL